jgi:hypothetical protein
VIARAEIGEHRDQWPRHDLFILQLAAGGWPVTVSLVQRRRTSTVAVAEVVRPATCSGGPAPFDLAQGTPNDDEEWGGPHHT